MYRKGVVLAASIVFVVISLVSCTTPPPVVASDSKDVEASSIDLSADDRKILEALWNNMVTIPSGSFTMGDSQDIGEDDELPAHRVMIKSFAISRFEVTFEQYDLFARMTGSEAPRDRWGRGSRPVIDVSWEEAQVFIQWVSRVTGKAVRLPSEAEWEYVARAGSQKRYSFGDDVALLCSYGNIADSSADIGWGTSECSDSYDTTAPVGSFKPNAFGVYDMHGNVWEWIEDCWYAHYRGAPDDSKARKKRGGCGRRAQRGGSWFYGPNEARASYRSFGDISDKSVTLGFRIASDI